MPSSPTSSTRPGSRPIRGTSDSRSAPARCSAGPGSATSRSITRARATDRRRKLAGSRRAIEALVGRPWVDRDGRERRLEVPDVLVVAPYNAQVAEIARTVERGLGSRPNVGTVDKFQGREAPVAIYSMTTSTPEDAPRDLDFLYSGNRLNVALSRARGLAVLVVSPALLRVACRSPEEIRLVNAFCRFVEIAARQSLPVDGSGGPSDERAQPIAVPLGVAAREARLVLFPELTEDARG